MMGMRAAIIAVIVILSGAAQAAMPPEWPRAAGAVLDVIEKGTPLEGRPRANNLYWRGWDMARKWRLANNNNTEIIFAEYLSWVQICRTMGCEGDTVGGKPYRNAAAEVRAERTRSGGQDPAVETIYRWTEQLFVLGWLVAQQQPLVDDKLNTMARFGLFAHGLGWIGDRCLDIRRIAAVLDGEPRVEACK
jgi:hypothetical protein